MIRILGSISGIICTIILFINFLLYLLKDIYFKTNKLNIRKTINLILPILSKYNKYLIPTCFICFFIHISCFFINISYFSLNFLILVLLLLIITFKLNIFSKSKYDYLRKIASYLIIIFILFHIFIY